MRHGRLLAGQRRPVVGSALAVSILAVLVALQASAATGTPTGSAQENAVPSASHAGTAACSSVKRGGTLLFGVDQDVISFDAANTQDNGSLWADMNIYDQLV